MTTVAGSQRADRRRAAWFAIDAAIEAGFALREVSEDCLEVLTPPGIGRELSEPILAALKEHRHEIIQTLRFLDACGVSWPSIPGPLQ